MTSPSIQDIYAALARDDKRNQMIVRDVVGAVHAKRFPVLLTERRDHLNALVDLLTPQIPNVIVMAGGMGKNQRKRLA
jgi:hypothetical protein